MHPGADEDIVRRQRSELGGGLEYYSEVSFPFQALAMSTFTLINELFTENIRQILCYSFMPRNISHNNFLE